MGNFKFEQMILITSILREPPELAVFLTLALGFALGHWLSKLYSSIFFFSPQGPLNEIIKDWKGGATFSAPISKAQSLRLQFHTGLMSNLGLNHDSVTLAYQYMFF